MHFYLKIIISIILIVIINADNLNKTETSLTKNATNSSISYIDSIFYFKIIAIVNQNLTLFIDWNALNLQKNLKYGWFYQDLNTGNNRSLVLDIRPHHLNYIYNENDYNLNIISFQMKDAGRKFIFKNLVNNKTIAIFNMIGIDDYCECKNEGKMYSTNIISLNKGDFVNLKCFIKLRKNLFENNLNLNSSVFNLNEFNDDPKIDWFFDNLTNIDELSLYFNKTKTTIEIYDSNKNIIEFQNEIILKIPIDNNLAWKLNNKKLYCQISHEKPYQYSSIGNNLSKKYLKNINITKDFHNLKKSVNCSLHLNINFEPFIDSNVNKTQFINENQLSIIECPIKAPKFQQNMYKIKWYFMHDYDSNNSHKLWLFKYSKEYDQSGDLYLISNSKFNIDNGKYKCELYDTKQTNPILIDIIDVHFYNQTNSSISTDLLSNKLKSSLTTFLYGNNLIINLFVLLIVVLISIAIILFFIFKYKLNKRNSKVTSDNNQTANDYLALNKANNEVNLKYELKNYQRNTENVNDIQSMYSVISESKNTIVPFNEQNTVCNNNNDEKLIKQLENLNNKDYFIQIFSHNLFKHNKTCPLYKPKKKSSLNSTSGNLIYIDNQGSIYSKITSRMSSSSRCSNNNFTNEEKINETVINDEDICSSDIDTATTLTPIIYINDNNNKCQKKANANATIEDATDIDKSSFIDTTSIKKCFNNNQQPINFI